MFQLKQCTDLLRSQMQGSGSHRTGAHSCPRYSPCAVHTVETRQVTGLIHGMLTAWDQCMGCQLQQNAICSTFEPHAARKLPLLLHSNSTLPSPSRSALTWKRIFISAGPTARHNAAKHHAARHDAVRHDAARHVGVVELNACPMPIGKHCMHITGWGCCSCNSAGGSAECRWASG